MNKSTVGAALTLLVSSLAISSEPVMASGVTAPFANKSFYCKGGGESSGKNYYFRAGANKVERLDKRFPEGGVLFQVGRASKGTLNNHWSYETLTEVGKGRMHLYERVSLRSSSQNKHIYRTYEMYSQNGKMFMILYDGVNGARDWRIKTTRKCGKLQGNEIVQGDRRSFWSTSFMR